jgi:hypothetical protein
MDKIIKDAVVILKNRRSATSSLNAKRAASPPIKRIQFANDTK